MILQEIRKKKGMTQKELAEKIGVSEWTIKAYEQGKRALENATIDIILDLCIALECSVEELFADDDKIKKSHRAYQNLIYGSRRRI